MANLKQATPAELLQQQLAVADAAYVDANPEMTAVALATELGKRMTPTLAAYIAANFEDASSINTSDITKVQIA